MTRAVLAFGSNLGEREDHLRSAVAALGDAVLTVSGVYEAPPWGDPDQPSYLNAVALVLEPDAPPAHWLTVARQLEERAGRQRDPERRFGPRTLDVDVITAWSSDGTPITSDDPELTLPHPRAHLRAFVLRPWLDIQPYAQLPGHGFVFDVLRDGPAAVDLAALRARDDVCLET